MESVKVMIADLFSPEAKAELEKHFSVIYDPKLDGPTLKAALEAEKPQVLVVRSTKVTAEMVDVNPNLAYVVRAGQGFDTIDIAYCGQKGVFVANCPGKNAVAVAELVFAHMFSIDRMMADGVALMHEGKWKKGMFANCKGIKGRTLGLLGLGNIGKEVATRANAFGMKVLAWDKFIPQWAMEAVGVEKIETPSELAERSDIISVHLPYIKKSATDCGTGGIICKEFLDKMKDDAVLINTSRGDLVVEEDLIAKLEACPKFWAGVDVYKGEPAAKDTTFDHAFGKHPRVYTSHHIGASTKQAEEAIGIEALRIVLKFGKTNVPSNVVNMGHYVKK